MSNPQVTRQNAGIYMRGLLDGTTITLRLLLGTAEGEGADERKAPQPIPEEIRAWAETALLQASMQDINQEVEDVIRRIR